MKSVTDMDVISNLKTLRHLLPMETTRCCTRPHSPTRWACPAVSITNGFTFGTPTFLIRPSFPDESRWQVTDTVTWTHGKHSMKFGGDFSQVYDNSQNLFSEFGSYSYSSLLNYFSDLNKPNTCSAGHARPRGPLLYQLHPGIRSARL